MNTALLVEDLPDIKKTTSEMLRKDGFNIISAGNLIDAKKIFQRRASQINIVIADCRLDEGDPSNIDGKKVASYIKKLNPDLPVVGVSAHKQVDTSMFDVYYRKGGVSGPKNFFDNIDAIKSLAEKYRQRHQKDLPSALIKIKNKYNIDDNDFRTLVQHHQLTPSIEKSLLAIYKSSCLASELEKKGLKKQEVNLISPDDPNMRSYNFRNPFICVASFYKDFVIAELYGFPMIYTYGDTYESALADLVNLLKDYFEELHHNKQEAKNDPDVVRFYCYLMEIFGERE
jgi:CheY-like chemotaxis protein